MKTKTTQRTHQRTNPALGVALLLAALGLTPLGAATTRHVWQDSPNPAPPYDSWATAAHVIQDAVDAAVDGDPVLVTNGVYSPINVSRSLTLQSVNGAEVTLINGQGAGRCATLNSRAVLSGFTLTNGWAEFGGGAHGGVLYDCTLTGNTAKYDGGGASSSTLTKCTLTGNSSFYEGGGASRSTLTNCTLIGNSAKYDGGGASESTLHNCTLTGNSANYGGAAYECTLTNCTLTANSADLGGGATGGTLFNCTLTGNSASRGSGAWGGTLYNCTLTGNSAANHGGGTYESTLYNCALTGNAAEYHGGGAYRGTLHNCTLTGNSAYYGGGAYGDKYPCTLYNCVAYHNIAPVGANHYECTFRYSCTTPLPPGEGNTDADPQLASASHLSPASPCIGAGSSAYSSGVDIDGEPWASPPCMGADQLTPGQASGALTMSIHTPCSRFAVGFAVPFVGDNTGPITASVWDFGDGTVVTNQPWIKHAWTTAGTYEVRLTGFNHNHPDGVTMILTVEVIEAVHYVNQANPTPVYPYTNWQTAATGMQQAIGAAVTGGLVVVTNGVYAAGEVTLTNLVRVRSVNGPGVTVIDGETTNRCASVGEQALLSGFTLTNGNGGVSSAASAVVSNCVISGNSGRGATGGTLYHCVLATNSGGGASAARLDHCTLTGNSAEFGGGAHESALYNCTLTGNLAKRGGGAYSATLSNCTLTANSASYWQGGGAFESTLYDCVITGNSAEFGGGVYSGTLYNCTLATNSAGLGGGAMGCALTNCTLTGNLGGGACECTLYHCALIGNSAWQGGGAWLSTLYSCTLSGNSAEFGGGASESALYNCTLTGNSARSYGGGTAAGSLTNCTLTGNSADYGGGDSGSWLINCTLTGNSAGSGGGAYESELFNCIVYYNTAPDGPDYATCWFSYSCTTPLPPGEGNIDADPQMASATHLSPASPCIGAGSAAYSSGVDIDGEPWANPPCMGADQLTPGHATGDLSMTITANYGRVKPGFAILFMAHNTGPLTASVWDFGDGTSVTNQPIFSHAWMSPGTYEVRLTGYNDSLPTGVSAFVTIYVDEGAFYVNQANPTPVYPYSNWQTAATSIQQAIDAAAPGSLVWVTNGTYGRVVIRDGVTVESVNGALVAIIDGQGGGRCATLGTQSVLKGFTLNNGVADEGGGVCGGTLYNCILATNSAGVGGGACAATLSNCTLAGNSASEGGGGAYGSTLSNCNLSGNSADHGGGAYESTLYNGTVSGNSATKGGGALVSTLYNCTLTGNSARDGGGAWGHPWKACTLYNCIVTGNWATDTGGGVWAGTLYNCIVLHNAAPDSPNYGPYSYFAYSCTTPLPPGEGNITNAPLFVDLAGGDFRLLPGSPGIDAGTNLSHLFATDLDGNPRPLDGNGDGIAVFDMGAYEYRPPTPAERVEALIAQVLASGLPQNRTKPLVATLEAAQASFARGSLGSGVNQLGAFQHKVRAQVAPEEAALAAAWIAAAQEIIDAVRASAGLRIEGAGAKAALQWQRGVLQEADALQGPWRDVRGAGSPPPVPPVSGWKFYRVKLE